MDVNGLVERLREEDQVTLGNIDEAEVENCPEWTFGCIQDARKLLREAADALARMEGERRDAQRYQWLRDEASSEFLKRMLSIVEEGPEDETQQCSADAWDSIIDSAQP